MQKVWFIFGPTPLPMSDYNIFFIDHNIPIYSRSGCVFIAETQMVLLDQNQITGLPKLFELLDNSPEHLRPRYTRDRDPLPTEIFTRSSVLTNYIEEEQDDEPNPRILLKLEKSIEITLLIKHTQNSIVYINEWGDIINPWLTNDEIKAFNKKEWDEYKEYSRGFNVLDFF